MYGMGILKGLSVTFKHFIRSYVDDIKYAGRKYLRQENFEERQGLKADGAFTVMYPEEKIAVPERFRFVPFLVVEDPDHPERPGEDWCTSCGICAKVCPPQCIWIVRGEDPVTKRPVPQPEAFFIDIDICMNCGYCAEFCPFDAIKMDHDYELASYDRTRNHIHDKERLSKPFSYWVSIAPTTATEEARDRGGWEHPDTIKEFKKSNRTPTPVTDDWQQAKANAAAFVEAQKAAAQAAAEAPPPVETAHAGENAPVAAESAPAGAPSGELSPEERKRRREEALARKKARQEQAGE